MPPQNKSVFCQFKHFIVGLSIDKHTPNTISINYTHDSPDTNKETVQKEIIALIGVVQSYLEAHHIDTGTPEYSEECVITGIPKYKDTKCDSDVMFQCADKILQQASDLEKERPLSDVAEILAENSEQVKKEQDIKRNCQIAISASLRRFAAKEKLKTGEIENLSQALADIAARVQAMHKQKATPPKKEIAARVVEKIQETWGEERKASFGLGERGGFKFSGILCNPDLSAEQIGNFVAEEVKKSAKIGDEKEENLKTAKTIAFKGRELVGGLADAICETVASQKPRSYNSR